MPQYAKEFGTLSINKGSKWDWRIKATVPFFLQFLSRSHNFSIIILSWGCFFGHFLCHTHDFCKPSISLGRLLGTCSGQPHILAKSLISWGCSSVHTEKGITELLLSHVQPLGIRPHRKGHYTCCLNRPNTAKYSDLLVIRSSTSPSRSAILPPSTAGSPRP